MLFLLLIILYLIYLIYYKKYKEDFDISNYLPITDSSYDNHQDIIMNNSNPYEIEKNKILAEKDSNLIPTYALYQPEVSGRHLNFFSHAPKEIPYFPNQVWSSTIQDPYYQPVYTNYFYNDGYFYPFA